ncbi:hypothetical protein D3C78_1790420 [compost metagenome]
MSQWYLTFKHGISTSYCHIIDEFRFHHITKIDNTTYLTILYQYVVVVGIVMDDRLS